MEVKIYQINSKFEDVNYTFLSWDSAKSEFNLDDYDLIEDYLMVKPLNATNGYSVIFSDQELLDYCETLFVKSNRGELKLAHSMSVSDVIQLGDRYFYCDSFGFKEIDL